MRPAYEPGYELHCQAQDGPYADDEVTEEVENFEAMVAAMHRDGTADDVAADGGEGEDMEDTHDPDDTGFAQPLHKYPPNGLVSMRNAIDHELKSRRDALARELAATEHALNGTKPRAPRSDKGKPRERKEVAA